jgi:uncharacterized protein DUF4079
VKALPYLHPAAMVVVLTLGLFVLRDGLRIRNGRLVRRPVASRRHRRLARVVVVLVIAGFGSGLYSMGVLRGKALFGSVHAWLATGALLGFTAGGSAGLWLERRMRVEPLRAVHAVTASVGLLLGLAAAIAGLAILP